MSVNRAFMDEVKDLMKKYDMTFSEALEDVHAFYRERVTAAELILAAYEDFLVDVWRSKQDAE